MTNLEYPDAETIHTLHADIVASDADTESGVHSPDDVESALEYIRGCGFFGQGPETIHEKAAHLMRFLVANHPYVDGNKRTALNTVELFYLLNGYHFAYEDESVRTILKEFAIQEQAVNIEHVIEYCRTHTVPED